MTLPVTLSAEALALFPDNYQSARASLLALAQVCTLLEDSCSFVLQADNGKATESLSTEILWLGPRQAQKVLVLVSATHGVEGYVGAAVQNDLLTRLQGGYRLPENTAILLVFALNPYGFAHNRRCDEKGIDLNRNFVDFDRPLPANPGYERLQQAIYTSDKAQREAAFAGFRQQWGQTEFEIAISGGQYTDPQGPFYGGREPAHGHQVIAQLITRYQLAQRHLAVVDIHSGLGLYAHGEVINDHPAESPGFRVAQQWYGASVTAPAMGSSSSVNKLGLMDYRWHALMAERGCFVTLEFGSYLTEALFDVILRDHRSWKSGDAAAITRAATLMREHFCPADSYWRELVMVKSRQVIQQAVDGLQHG